MKEGCKIKYQRMLETLTIKHNLDAWLCIDTRVEQKGKQRRTKKKKQVKKEKFPKKKRLLMCMMQVAIET